MTNSRFTLRFALAGIRSGNPKISTSVLDQMLRPQHYPHGIRYPIEHCTADDNIILPETEAAIWLYTERDMERIGPWETALQRDDDGYYLVVNFARDEDAVLFKMKWGKE